MIGDFVECDEDPFARAMAVSCWRVQCEYCDSWDIFFSDPFGLVVRCSECNDVIKIV